MQPYALCVLADVGSTDLFHWESPTLSDYRVYTEAHPGSNKLSLPKALGTPRWFARGWTLQELIAPRKVEFYNSKWLQLGTKRSLCK
jgi:hypothetical protein